MRDLPALHFTALLRGLGIPVPPFSLLPLPRGGSPEVSRVAECPESAVHECYDNFGIPLGEFCIHTLGNMVTMSAIALAVQHVTHDAGVASNAPGFSEWNPPRAEHAVHATVKMTT